MDTKKGNIVTQHVDIQDHMFITLWNNIETITSEPFVYDAIKNKSLVSEPFKKFIL